MEKMNEKNENGENLVIIIKLELENEEKHSDETVDSKELLDAEKERSKTQIENKDKQRDTSLVNESIGDLFCDAFEEIPNPESSLNTAERSVLAGRERIRKEELRFISSEQSLVNEEDNFVKCSARVVFVDEVSQSGTIFNYVPNLSTTLQATEPKTDGIETGETKWNEPDGINGKESLKNKCQKCLKDFANKTSLLLHIDDKHPEVRNPRPLPCKFCDDIFTIKPRFVSHMEKVHGKSYGLGLREREIVNRDENFGVCRWCGKEYKREKALRNHERLHTGETPYNCKLCGNSFELKVRLDAHVRSQHAPIVPEKNKSENNASSFKLKAKNERRREADKVENATTDYLKREQNVIFDDDGTSIVKKSTGFVKIRSYASVQGRKEKFKKYPALKARWKTHPGEGPFCCYHKDCGKSFMTDLKLKVHERIHKKELPFTCDWEGCGKKFTLSAHCKRHFMTHTGEKPHICNECNKKFSRTDRLKIHLRTHTGEKPHVCNECDKKFSQKHQLKNHLRTHTGEKPHVCQKCNKRFTRTDHLKKHTTRCVAS